MDDKEVIIQYERELWSKGYKNVAGIDEAGRGPLAGPVVAAAVVFPPDTQPFLHRDSKKLKESEREAFFQIILKRAKAVGIGIADSLEIEKFNIYKATLLAVKRALEQLPFKPDYLITDYLKVEGFEHNSLILKKGDEKSFSCACASVVAKVCRDFIMKELSIAFPEYGFAKHKGYPTKAHIEAVENFGITPIHRRNFERVKGKRLIRRETGFPVSLEERLLYYREKLQVLLR